MMVNRKYWLAVVGRAQKESEFLTQGWWCVQSEAQEGDRLLAYRTQNSGKNHGIFALCEVMSKPDPQHENASFCTPYGKQSGELFFTKIRLLKEFSTRLGLQEIKTDPLLNKLSCVVRNFQGTTFELPETGFI